MKLSTRGRYAVMAMVELAARQHGQAVPCAGTGPERSQVTLAEIAQSQKLSLAYLEQLFGPLRRAGLVASVRGPGGGYRLARPPGAITVAEVVLAVDEPIQATRCDAGSPGCLAGVRCPTHDLWAELGDHIRLFLEGITLADVICGAMHDRAAPPHPAPRHAAE